LFSDQVGVSVEDFDVLLYWQFCGFRFSRVLFFVEKINCFSYLLDAFGKLVNPKSCFAACTLIFEFMDNIFVFSFETKNLISVTGTGNYDECLVSHSVHYFYA